MSMRNRYHGIYILIAFLACLTFGTAGYYFIEGWDLLESLYMTVITITTVGFQEENPLSPEGKIFTIFLIFFGFGISVYFFSNLVQLLLKGELLNWVRRYFMSARVELFDDHYILCGYGRMGKVVAEQLSHRKIPFVIIEKDPDKAPDLSDTVHPVIIGNAGEEGTLKGAAIDKARGLISVVNSDAENAFIMMTAKRMKPELHMVSRCIKPFNVDKLKLAGANQVVSTFELSGHRLTQAALHPTMVEFVDFLENVANEAIEMADILVDEKSTIVGSKLSSPEVSKMGVMIVGIKKKTSEFSFNPTGETIIEADDHLVVVGPKDKVIRVADHCG